MDKFKIPEGACVETPHGTKGEVLSMATQKSTGDRLYAVVLKPACLFHRWYREDQLKVIPKQTKED